MPESRPLFVPCLAGFIALYAAGGQFNRIRHTSSMKRLSVKLRTAPGSDSTIELHVPAAYLPFPRDRWSGSSEKSGVSLNWIVADSSAGSLTLLPYSRGHAARFAGGIREVVHARIYLNSIAFQQHVAQFAQNAKTPGVRALSTEEAKVLDTQLLKAEGMEKAGFRVDAGSLSARMRTAVGVGRVVLLSCDTQLESGNVAKAPS